MPRHLCPANSPQNAWDMGEVACHRISMVKSSCVPCDSDTALTALRTFLSSGIREEAVSKSHKQLSCIFIATRSPKAHTGPLIKTPSRYCDIQVHQLREDTMPFYPPAWVPKMPMDPPDSISLEEFMLNPKYGRHAIEKSQDPFTCGISGKSYSALEMKDRVDQLARGLSKELGFRPNEGTAFDKVIGVFSVNTVSSARCLAWVSCSRLTDRYHYTCVGYPSSGRYSDPSQRGIRTK